MRVLPVTSAYDEPPALPGVVELRGRR